MANKRRTPPPFLKGRKISDAKHVRQHSYLLGQALNNLGWDLADESNVRLIKDIYGEGAFNAAIATKG